MGQIERDVFAKNDGYAAGDMKVCLAIPARIIDIDGVMATAEVGGVCKEISLALVDGVAVNDYVIVHLGYALNRLDPTAAEETLELFRQVAQAAGVPWPEQAA